MRNITAYAAALAASAFLVTNGGCAEEPTVRERAIALAADMLDEHADIMFFEHDDDVPGVDFGDLFGGIGSPAPGVPTTPALAGGTAAGPTQGTGGFGSPDLMGGEAAIPSLGVGGVGMPAGMGVRPDFAQALCNFVGAICKWLGRCGGGLAASECALFAGSQCPMLVSQELARAGVSFVPAGVVQWLNCSANVLSGAGCYDEVLFHALFTCLPPSLGGAFLDDGFDDDFDDDF